MDVKSRIFWLSTQQTQLVNELFLEGIREIVLRAEEDHATLRNWRSCQTNVHKILPSEMPHTCDGNISESFISVLAIEQVVNDVDIEELPTNDRSSILMLELV